MSDWAFYQCPPWHLPFAVNFDGCWMVVLIWCCCNQCVPVCRTITFCWFILSKFDLPSALHWIVLSMKSSPVCVFGGECAKSVVVHAWILFVRTLYVSCFFYIHEKCDVCTLCAMGNLLKSIFYIGDSPFCLHRSASSLFLNLVSFFQWLFTPRRTLPPSLYAPITFHPVSVPLRPFPFFLRDTGSSLPPPPGCRPLSLFCFGRGFLEIWRLSAVRLITGEGWVARFILASASMLSLPFLW